MPLAECENKATGQDRLLNFFGLREQPFGVTPDPRFLYFSPSHREAFASLIYAIEAKRGFSALIAEPGMGKTSLLFHLLEKIQNSARTAFLFQPEPDQHGLLRSLLVDLGIDAGLKSVSHMHEALNQILLLESQTGRHFVVVIDEAQDLEDSVLESVRLLSNFETPHAKLMHIVLAGQPALANRLAKPELSQLRQRIAAWAGLSSFTVAECSEYIDHRLKLAGYKGANLFPAGTKQLIATASRGLPRNINNICFACLSLGYATQQSQVNTAIVQEVLRDQKLEQPERTAVNPPRRIVPEFHYLPPLPEAVTRRKSRGIGGAIVGLIVVPLLLISLATEMRMDFLGSGASAIRDNIIERITSTPPHAVDSLPYLPLSEPPTIDLSPVTAALQQETTNFSSPPLAQQDDGAIPAKTSTHSRLDEAPRHSSRVVVVRKQETLFQLAMDHYGRSNWVIVRKIREQNPNIKDPYSYVDEGQHVVLPDLSPQFPWKEDRRFGAHSWPQ
jgi:general secretion pathway protein A